MPTYGSCAIKARYIGEPKYELFEPVYSPFIKRFFRNVKYVLAQQNRTIQGMCKDIYIQYGYRIGINAVSNYINGTYTRCNSNTMGAICLYLGEDYLRMQSEEYSEVKHRHKRTAKQVA